MWRCDDCDDYFTDEQAKAHTVDECSEQTNHAMFRTSFWWDAKS